jgi:hypothetical protein
MNEQGNVDSLNRSYEYFLCALYGLGVTEAV